MKPAIASQWQPPETLLQEDGTEVILWLTTDKGFPDVSAHCFFKDGSWYWMDTHEVIIAKPNNFQPIQINQLSAKHRFIRTENNWNGYKRQDYIMGWQPRPNPPCEYSLLQNKN